MTTTILPGDCRTVLPTLPAGRFRCCVTSPPYWMQRRYLPAGHPDEAREIGREYTFHGYVDALVGVFREVRRVLADDGTLWINIGDKYAVDPGGQEIGGGASLSMRHVKLVGAARYAGRLQAGQAPGVPAKSLIGLPWRLALALIDDGWTLRQEILWHKVNAMPESVEDRPTRAHEQVFFFSKSASYYYDQNAIREPATSADRDGRSTSASSFRRQAELNPRGVEAITHQYHPDGRNARSVWSIPLEATGGDHAAPMPRALARRCLLAGSAIGDHVLDPFAGGGTLGAVAEQDGRHATLIDLDARACDLARGKTAQAGLPFASGEAGSP